MNLEEILRKQRVIVLLGAGGVGKTSSSIGLAIAAARLGLKVGLLSIDPAKRLAAALGIPLGHDLKPLAFTELAGGVDAAMLDQKAVFDTMVRRHARDEASAARILANPLYRAASTKLAGPMEYMALAKLQDMVDAGRYDLVILDTPPDSQALEFLGRPNILAGFMEHKVMSWLIKPFHMASRFGVDRIFSAGGRLMGGLAKVTGLQALKAVTEFLVLMQQVIDGFHKASERVVTTLRSPDTAFMLVTVLQQGSLRSAQDLARELRGLGYPLGGVFFNKCLPKEVIEELAQEGDPGLPEVEALRARALREKAFADAFRDQLKRHTSTMPPTFSLSEQEQLLGREGVYQFSLAFRDAVQG